MGTGKIVSEMIAYYLDDDGNKREISMIDVYQTMMDMVKIRYFDYMIRHQHMKEGEMPPLDRFKEHEIGTLEHMINFMHDHYQDHVEGARREVQMSKSPLNTLPDNPSLG